MKTTINPSIIHTTGICCIRLLTVCNKRTENTEPFPTGIDIIRSMQFISHDDESPTDYTYPFKCDKKLIINRMTSDKNDLPLLCVLYIDTNVILQYSRSNTSETIYLNDKGYATQVVIQEQENKEEHQLIIKYPNKENR